MTREGLAVTWRVVAVLGRRSVTQTFRRPQLLAPIIVFPSLFLAVNTGGAGQATNLPGFPEVHGFLDFQLAAAIMQSTMLAGVSGGIALALDIESGFTDRLFASPIARSAIVAGRLTATAILGVLVAVWFLAIGLIFGAHIQAGIAGAVLVVVLTTMAAVAFGSFGAALALRAGRASVVQGIFPIVFVILFLSTAFFPQELMLEPAQTLARYNPLSFISDGIREPIAFGWDAEVLLKGLGGLAIIGAAGVLLSIAGLRARVGAA